MPSQKLKRISASSAFPYRTSIVFSGILAFLISFMFMGTAFARFFSGLFIILASLTLVATAITRPTNWFGFDDENRLIVKAFRNRIPYNRILAIVIRENFKNITVNVETNWLPPYPIVSGLSKNDAELAEMEFKQRFPHEIIRRETFSNKRHAILIALVSFVFLIWFAFLLHLMYRMQPIEVTPVEKNEWLSGKQPQEGTHYQINGISFLLPDRFTQIREEKGWYYFEDKISKTKVNVGPTIFHNYDFAQCYLFGFLLGIRDDYDFYRLGYKARFGLMPTLNNSHTFKDLFDIKLYEVARGKSRGIALQGLKGNKSIAQIIITDREQGIHFYLSQPREIGVINEAMLQSIVSSIQTGS